MRVPNPEVAVELDQVLPGNEERAHAVLCDVGLEGHPPLAGEGVAKMKTI